MSGTLFVNSVTLVGKVMNIAETHQQYGVSFCDMIVRVNRLTPGKYDDIPVNAPKWAVNDITVGMTVKVEGEIRSYRNYRHGWQTKRIAVYSSKITVQDLEATHSNEVKLRGKIKKIWPLRTTPMSGRVITDFSMFVGRTSGYASNDGGDIIYCVAWSKYAQLISALHEDVQNVDVTGRLQVRTFEKRFDTGDVDTATVAEVSCQRVRIL